MKSIRIFLIIALISTITLVNFLSALHGYRESMTEAEKLFDAQLAEDAYLLAQLVTASRDTSLPFNTLRNSELTYPYRSEIEFQIWQDGQLTLKSANAPEHIIAPLTAGYQTVNFSGYRWRILIYPNSEKELWIIAAQRNDVRYKIAEQLILKSVLPTVLWLPLAGILIWFIVGFGLKPIQQLATELSHKQASDLGPVKLSSVPKELSLLAESANDLLHRLEASFDRERRFAADAAHELRTPLSVLKVQIHNLIAASEQPGSEMQQLKAGIDRMSHLVEQILELNRVEPDIYMAQLSCLDLTAAAQRAIRENYEQFAAKNQTIEFEGAATTIYADAHATDILLANLLGNASKFTPEHGRVIVKTEVEGSIARLKVIDSGPGIPTDQYERVFERFYRVGGDRHSTNTLGCGLGLAIVARIVQLHGASIELSPSEFDSGLTVTVFYPIDSRCHITGIPS